MMIRFVNHKVRWILFATVVLLSTLSPAQSRTWSRDPASLAQDYAVINDNRSGGEVVMVLWMVPPLVPNTPSTQRARDMLEKYVVLGVAHAHIAKDATMTFDSVTALQARDGNGQPLTSLNENTMPPTVVGALATMKSAFGRSLGALGTGMQWFVFDGGAVHACTKGRMSVPFAGETYTYDTPIPGCP